MITELAVAVLLGYTPLDVPNHEINFRGEVVIYDTAGGRLNGFNPYFRQWKDEGRTLIIYGMCSSACTLALGNPKACAMPKAVFGFHQARHWNRETGELGGTAVLATEFMWSHYSEKVKAVIKRLTPDMQYFKGTDLLPSCL
jgi:hypothetical protein